MFEAAPDPRISAALSGRRVWISGARGFLGRWLASAAEAHGCEVHAFAGDVRDAAAVLDSVLAARPAVLFHLAARVDVARDESLDGEMRATAYEGALHVADAAAALGGALASAPGSTPPLLVHVGTCEEYGRIPAPFREDAEPSLPVSPYARWKLAATRELLRRACLPAPGLRLAVARPFLSYGPGQRARQIVPQAIEAALDARPFEMTDGLQTRELNFAEDTALGLLRCACAPDAEGRVVNVAGGDERRVLDIVRLVFDCAGADPGLIQAGALPRRAGEVDRFVADTALCRGLLGHLPRVSLADGLRRTIAWQRAARAERERASDPFREVQVTRGRRQEDPRGWLHVALAASQLPASARFGELYAVRAERAGDRRGDHLHRRMDEWFSVVEGRAMLELFDPSRGARREIALDAHEPVAVRVPAGIAHCLVNAGEGPMLALAWSTAEHDPADVEALSTRAETPSPPGTLPRPA